MRYKEPGTQEAYLERFWRFLEFTGPEIGVNDPEALVKWAKTHSDSLEVQDIIEKFAETKPPASQGSNITAVRSFLKRNGYGQLPSMARPPAQLNWHPGYKRHEIQQLLGYLDNKVQKFYVVAGKDCGLRATMLISLRYRHVKKDLEAGSEFVHLYLEPRYYGRRKAAGLTFLGPNSVKALRELIKEGRIRTDPDSRLFPQAYGSITEAIRRARNKAGLDPLIQPNHGLRKFFENSLDKVGMDHHKKLQLEGHSQGVRAHYTDRDVEELRKLYQQAYQYLDLSEQAAADLRVKDLETKVKTLEEHKAKLESRLAELDLVKQKVERMEFLGKFNTPKPE